MNPFQLLAVGQSLIKGRNQPSPYKIDEQHLLPKFAKVGRPISLAPSPKPVAVPKNLFRSVRGESAGVVPSAVVKVPVLAKTTLAPAAAPATVSPVLATSVGGAEPKAKRVKKLFGFGTKTTPAGRLVQAELSLNAVKVICNDLSDSDLEIVASKPTLAPAPTSAPAPAPETATTTVEAGRVVVSLWQRWSSRLTGAMRTIF